MELKDKVEQILNDSINPAIASHGGFVRVDRVEGNDVYLIMGGGCQGCAASSLTLKMGIEKYLKEEIPELGEVIDATDHAAGVSPFIEYIKDEE